MSPHELQTAISMVLGSLTTLLHDMQKARARQNPKFREPKALIEANRQLASLAEAQARAPSPSRREQALGAWAIWKQGRSEIPTPVLLRALCWEPEVVSDKAFQTCLRTVRPLRGRTIQALLPTYLRLWRQGGDPDPLLSRVLKEDLTALATPRGVVARWRDHMAELLGPTAAERFARDAFARKTTVRSKLDHLRLATDTQFACCAASHLLETATSSAQQQADLDWLLGELFPQDSPIAHETGWGPALRNLILDESLTRDEQIRERIMDFALRDLDLGDPRVSTVPWHPVGEEATREVIRWRSSEDLRLFFDLVMKGKEDYQGRHRFWQRYVDGVTRSLIVLSRSDEDRLRRRLRELTLRGRRFVRMTGTNLTSAFVMEFGRAVVVEFSEAGNACYVYQEEKGKGPIPWQAAEVDIHVLKNRRRAKDWLRHVRGWEYTFTNSLARLGIRPVYARKRPR